MSTIPAICGQAICGQTICGQTTVNVNFEDKNLSFSDYGENPKINLLTRRILYVQPDISIGANSYEISVTHIYDSEMKIGVINLCKGMPAGWKLDAHQFLVEDGRDSNNNLLYKYIDGAGYTHQFIPFEENSTRYYDTDGLGMVLMPSENTIEDVKGNQLKFNDGVLVEKVSCYNSTMKKNYQYSDGRLYRIFDSRAMAANVPTAYLQFNYDTSGFLSSITAVSSGETKQSIEYVYSDGRLIEVKKITAEGMSKTICKYLYHNFGKLKCIIDTERLTAVQTTYVDGDSNRSVSTISNGIVDEWGNFTEKTFISIEKSCFDSSEFAVREVQIYNEKNVCCAIQLNREGRIIGSYECDRNTEELKTLTRERGILISLAGTGRKINGLQSASFVNGIVLNGISATTNYYKECRFYNLRCHLNHSSFARRLKAKLNYTLSTGVTYTSEVEVDATAVEAWQILEIPIDLKNYTNGINSMTLEIIASDGSNVSALLGSVRLVSSTQNHMYIGSSSMNYNDIKTYKITTVNATNGNLSAQSISVNVSAEEYFTQNDIVASVNSMIKTYQVQGRNCFDLICNNGKKKIANVASFKVAKANGEETSIEFASDSGVTSILNKLELSDALTSTCYSIVKAMDNRSQTTVKIIASSDKIGTVTSVSVSTDKEKDIDTVGLDKTKTSTACALTDYFGNTIKELDAYGIITIYEYNKDGSIKRATTKGTDGKYTVFTDITTDDNAEYIDKVRSGFDAQTLTYNKPYNQINKSKIDAYDFINNTTSTSNSYYKNSYDVFLENVERIEAYTGNVPIASNSVEYKNGRISKVFDGRSTYGVNYGAVDDTITFQVYDNGTPIDIQKHRTQFDNEGNIIKTDSIYRSEEEIDTSVTRVDKYGKIQSHEINDKTVSYTYTNTDGGSSATDVLSSIYDAFEGRTYTYGYDNDGNAVKCTSSYLSIEQMSATDTKYTFKNNSEKYLSSIIYDEEATISPRIVGVRNYLDVNGNVQDDFQENFDGQVTGYEIFSWKYEYDKCGRLYKKINKYDNAADGTYTYSYLTSGSRTMPLITSSAYVGRGFLLVANVALLKFNFDYKYDNKGQIQETKEVFDCNGKDWIVESTIKKEYTYDDFNRMVSEKIYYDNETSPSAEYDYLYYENGRPERINFGNNNARLFGYNSYGYRNRSFFFNGFSLISYKSFWYAYDDYGNRIRRSYVLGNGDAEGSTIYNYHWMRGSCLEKVTYGSNDGEGNLLASYEYDRNGNRFKKTVKGVTTEYYIDGGKIVGEDRSNGTKLRYFYEMDGICGFRYYNGTSWASYSYVKNPEGSIVMIKDYQGVPLCRYTYDTFGKATIHKITAQGYQANELETIIGQVNPFRWKGHYYDADMEEQFSSGYYYINGRYYDPNEGIYLDADPVENMIANGKTAFGLDRHTAWYDNVNSLIGYDYTVFSLAGLVPSVDKTTTGGYTLSGGIPWWSWMLNGTQVLAGIALLFTPLAGFGVGLIFSGGLGIMGNILGSQTASGLGMTVNGLQTVITSVQLILGACNPVVLVLGWIGVVAGVATTAFGTAEVQEGLGYGNWIKDSGMSEGLYSTAMMVSAGVSTFVCIVGPIANKYGPKCFMAGTLVLCMDEAGNQCHKPIEDIKVGDMVWAYDEETGENDWKPVVRLFRNESKDWTGVTVNGLEIVSTPGHKYCLPETKKWVSAEELKVGVKVLLSDGGYGIIEAVRAIHYDEPQTTYNFEVVEFHTYYISELNILVHNRCKLGRNMEKAGKSLKPTEDAHHLYPQQFRPEFKNLNIDVDDAVNGIAMDSSIHRAGAQAYNKAWGTIIESITTVGEAEMYMKKFMQEIYNIII